MWQKECFFYLLGLTLLFREFQIHYVKFLWRFCWVSLLWAWGSLWAADVARTRSSSALAAGALLLHLKSAWLILASKEFERCRFHFTWLIPRWCARFMFLLLDILDLDFDELWLILILLKPVQIVQMAILIHYQVNLSQRKAFNLTVPTCSIKPLKLWYLHKVLQDLSHILSQTRPVIVVMQCRVSDVQT